MGLRKRLVMGTMSAALGLFLIGGGTYAYFSDTTEVQAMSETGTLEINVDGNSSFDFTNMKPGDEREINFTLTNDGSLDIDRVFLGVENSHDEFAKYLKVKAFNVGSDNQFNIARIKDVNGNGYIDLDDLAQISAEGAINLRGSFGVNTGVRNIHLKVEFVETGENQNDLQGVSNDMILKFDARHD